MRAAPPPATITLRTPGMVLGRDDGQVVALMAQPPGWSFVEQAEAKYHKFAYSSRFGFSGDFTMYGLGATDSMLAVTDPATGVRRVRDGVVLSEAADGVALTRWSPMPGVRVDTALDGGAPWHVRVHRVSTDREVALTETGFALSWEPEGFAPPAPEMPERGHALAASRVGRLDGRRPLGPGPSGASCRGGRAEPQRQHHVAAHDRAGTRDDGARR